MSELRTNDLHDNPSIFDGELTLRDGTRLQLRLHLPSDGEALANYFTHLSPATRRVYGPHPFTAEQAHTFCRYIDYAHTLRFLALEGERIVAYFILHLGVLDNDAERYRQRGQSLHPATDCTLAPSVADDFQERGVGSALFPQLALAAQRLGKQRIVLWGGVRADNPRAVHFYQKMGFVEWGQFETRDTLNFDMVLDL